MERVALVLSALSLLVAAGGTYLANVRAKASASIAREALAESRDAATQVLWSSATEAVQRIIGLDPATEPINDRFRDLRVHLTALVDGLQDWEGMDRWLANEHVVGAGLAREVMENAKPADTPDQHFVVLKPFLDWGMVLSQNLRRFRNIGYDGEIMRQLIEASSERITAIYTRNEWPPPPTEIEGVMRLGQPE